MTPQTAKKLLPIITAFSNGEDIQYRASYDSPWMEVPVASFDGDPGNYRIKPKPTWRPWKPSECPKVFVVGLKSKPQVSGAWQAVAKTEDQHQVVIIDGYPIRENETYRRSAQHEFVSFKDLFDQFVQILPDGSHQPCGILDTNPSA